MAAPRSRLLKLRVTKARDAGSQRSELGRRREGGSGAGTAPLEPARVRATSAAFAPSGPRVGAHPAGVPGGALPERELGYLRASASP